MSMKLDELVANAREAITVRRVYAEPYEREGVTVIAAATVAGGAGGGGGKDEQKHQEGEGGGFGVNARPVGAYVIKDRKVSWRPAIDVNRVVVNLSVVLVVFLIARARVAKARAKAEA